MQYSRGYHGRRRHRGREVREEFAYVLDYNPYGLPGNPKPFVQLIGEDYFMLLEATPRREAELEVGERVYIGPEAMLRTKIHRVTRELEYEELTNIARASLPEIVREIVESREEVFVEFYNIADAITIRLHSLELLPGIGKKTALKIIDARKARPFTSFQDIRERVGIDPVKPIVERILEELQEEQHYYLFAIPPRRLRRKGPEAPVWLNYVRRAIQSLSQKKS